MSELKRGKQMLQQEKGGPHKALLQMPYGIYIVTTHTSTGDHGLTASWVMQISKAPPMVAAAVKKGSESERAISSAGAFAINILSSENADIAERFFTPVGRFDKPPKINIRSGMMNLPLLENAIGWLECKISDSLEVGDHQLLIGEVLAGRLSKDEKPLTTVETGFRYGGVATPVWESE